MGSYFEINDTLQITSDQGFPAELDINKHLQKPYLAKDFQDKVFEFKEKPGLRFYQVPPVRVFLVQNIAGKWLYWGLAHILSTAHDYQKKTTSGEFRIEYVYTLEEMKKAHDLIDRNERTNYFL
jgi:hypothetical protein